MAFQIEVTGMVELFQKMDKLGEKGRQAASIALYEGAGVVADAVGQAVQGIATEPFKYAKNGTKRKPSPEEKAAIVGARHGVAKFRKNTTSVNTSVGLQNSGYGTVNGKTVPVPLIANAINSGTSFMEKQPFMRKAFSQSKGSAMQAIEEGLKTRLEEMSEI